MGHGPQQQCTRTRTPTPPKMVRLVKSNRSRAGFRYQRHDKHVGHGHGQGAQAREPGEGDEPRLRRAALVVAQKRHDDEDENDDAPGFGDADGCSAGKVVGGGDEPTATAENPTEHTSGRRRRPRSSSRRAATENRAMSSAAIKAGSVRLPRTAAAGSPGQRREKRACLREERHGEQAEQQIGHEDRDDDGMAESTRARAPGPARLRRRCWRHRR